MNNEKPKSLADFACDMKRDWDYRANENAKWFINTFKLHQSDDEFYATGDPLIERFVLSDPILTEGRDLNSLRLLEIGCGIGRMTKRLAQVFGEVHAVDVSAEMINQACERFRGVKNAFFYETNGLDFSALPDNYFDVIFSVYVFQHVPSVDVIHSNIRDACRTLKPGGMFKFQACGITSPAYEAMPKDTWAGTSFGEADIRRAARESGAHLVSITGLGAQYCWTILRKPLASVRNADAPATRPKIELFGRSDTMRLKAIPIRSNLKLIVSGFDPDEVDANSVAVEINGQDFLPFSVGRIDGEFTGAMRVDGSTRLTQIEICVPGSLQSGIANVRVKHPESRPSEAVTLELLEPLRVPPRIEVITNMVDGGVDVYAQGEKSVFRVSTHGLDDAATTDNVRVLVGEHEISPDSVIFLPANALHMAIAKMPEHVSAGEVEVRIQFRDLVSESKRVILL
jgi:2-polyprenyl-3-methyl-5-hydroxy-6-metoxy-1,4-benzoquinol methylase